VRLALTTASVDWSTVASIVSPTVAISALLISATSLWHSALRPAEITLDHLASDGEVLGGGTNDVPGVYEMHLTFAVVNAGARAGLLKSIDLAATATGAPDFARGIASPRLEPAISEVGVGPVSFPRTVEAGDVRSYLFRVELEGSLRDAVHTRTLEAPDREPLAQLLADLGTVEIVASWCYRRSVGFLHARRTDQVDSVTVSIPGQRFRQSLCCRAARCGCLTATPG